jgi:hypothetical protein
MGTAVTLCTEAGDFTSTVSQVDADNKALTWINANGQNKANNEGECIPAKMCPDGFDAGGQVAYQATRIVLGDNPGTVRFLLGTYAQADAFSIYYGDVTPTSFPIWTTRELPTADPTTGMVSTTAISMNNYHDGEYYQYKPCANEIVAGNGHESMYEVVITFNYIPTDPDINFVTLVTQAPEEGTRWSYKMGCPCNGGTPENDWNYCQSCINAAHQSTALCAVVQKNNCPSGQSGSMVNVCTTPGQFTSQVSQADANNKAQAWLNANEQNRANELGTCAVNSVVYWNTEQCQNFQKNDCPSGQSGTTVNVCVDANSYSSDVSQEDANNKATVGLVTNGQNEANETGSCTDTPVFYNDEICELFVKSDCGEGEQGSSETVCVNAADPRFDSYASQAAANNAAQTWLTANGQPVANTNGSCSTISVTPLWQPQTPAVTNCSLSESDNTGNGGSYFWESLIQSNPNCPDPAYETTQWFRSSANDTVCTGSVNPVWETYQWSCSCNADSISGVDDGSYAFKWTRDINPNSPTYGQDQPGTPFRDSANDSQCPNVEGTWVDEGTLCDGCCKYTKQVLWNCGNKTAVTRPGTLVESKSPDCGYTYVCNANVPDGQSSYECDGTTRYFLEYCYENGVWDGTVNRTGVSEPNSESCGFIPSYCNNVSYTGYATRECDEGMKPDDDAYGSYTVSTGEVCGYDSQEAANNAASQLAQQTAQDYANQNGSCISENQCWLSYSDNSQGDKTFTIRPCTEGDEVVVWFDSKNFYGEPVSPGVMSMSGNVPEVGQYITLIGVDSEKAVYRINKVNTGTTPITSQQTFHSGCTIPNPYDPAISPWYYLCNVTIELLPCTCHLSAPGHISESYTYAPGVAGSEPHYFYVDSFKNQNGSLVYSPVTASAEWTSHGMVKDVSVQQYGEKTAVVTVSVDTNKNLSGTYAVTPINLSNDCGHTTTTHFSVTH